MSSSSASSFSPDHHIFQHTTPSLSDQLCYVHCNLCDTVLAVSVPGSCLFKTVTVRCGHCTNLLSVNMRGLLLPPPPPPPPHHHATSLFNNSQNHLITMEEMQANMNLMNQFANPDEQMMVMPLQTDKFMAAPPAVRPPEKRQRVPSAYNRFIKEEIRRIKAGNPDISHREAFSAAAKNWAHFPHIHFGLLPDQSVRRSAASLLQQ